MKINSINNNYNNFKGLWGETKRNTDVAAVMNVPQVKVSYYYYPYSDEEYWDVSQVVKDTSKAYFGEDGKYYVKECQICTRTPFTQNDYQEYSKLKGYNPAFELIDSYAKTKYINCDYKEQKSAANPAFVSVA